MKKRGFTLTELLAVVIMLGLITMIALGSIGSILKRSREKARNTAISELKQAATKHVAENISDFNEEDEYCLTIEDLLNTPHLKGDRVIDPVTNEDLIGTIIVKVIVDDIKIEFKETKVCP